MEKLRVDISSLAIPHDCLFIHAATNEKSATFVPFDKEYGTFVPIEVVNEVAMAVPEV